MYQALDVMRTNVITICADATVEDAIRSLLQHDISGAPVVDDQGSLVGIISELQLLEAVYTPEVKERPVRHFMTKDVLTVVESTLLSDVTSLLVLHRIRRVPVVGNGSIVGIITRRDLLRYTLDAGDTLEACLDQVKTFVNACPGSGPGNPFPVCPGEAREAGPGKKLSLKT